VLFATATEWVTRLADAHQAGRPHDELRRLGRYPLLCDSPKPHQHHTHAKSPSVGGSQIARP
jgi:hypothetical protein